MGKCDPRGQSSFPLPCCASAAFSFSSCVAAAVPISTSTISDFTCYTPFHQTYYLGCKEQQGTGGSCMHLLSDSPTVSNWFELRGLAWTGRSLFRFFQLRSRVSKYLVAPRSHMKRRLVSNSGSGKTSRRNRNFTNHRIRATSDQR
uniref:Uncharacterized protein n=1 Tax=Chromera velia CCMP2878 TaxID=1169474 RepID=A0A0G4FKJ8_9ALVE|eukprot:Cvel_3442.t1-p1 / transcript=Cvel_3442.t1 / gene=Cvel_3442 / organism=Chromera_velia_CCMP2878 / gene_product=hypothetical protein / transcript_product=hypothetical protein / location=Cvel_scaffold138:94229-96142(-) / protein_length=145 / sequence_SO=supercontig / SO=protein_coding / is_pseudo=false